MPTVRNPQANSVQRRVSVNQPSFERPVTSDGNGKCEGQGEPDEAEIQHRRVEGHQRVVLQQRVRARSVRTEHGSGLEGIGRAQHQGKEEQGHDKPVRVAQPTSGSVDRFRKCTCITVR